MSAKTETLPRRRASTTRVLSDDQVAFWDNRPVTSLDVTKQELAALREQLDASRLAAHADGQRDAHLAAMDRCAKLRDELAAKGDFHAARGAEAARVALALAWPKPCAAHNCDKGQAGKSR